jgi:BirA family biotin operon repressor/biotin-[acetyl-CoA-carboxylase] ligase
MKRLLQNFITRNIIKTEINFKEINSTQKYARNYISENYITNWVMISAEKQTDGIGRYHRKWHSPDGVNLYISFIIPIKQDFKLISLLPILTSVTISQTLCNFNCENSIKWVNDILVNDSKIAGILIESISEGENIFAIIGIGLNVNMSQEENINIDQKVTSMRITCGKILDRERVKEYLKKKLQENIINYEKIGIDWFYEYYNNRLAFKGRMIELEQKDGNRIKGKLKRINENGFIVLEIDDQNDLNEKVFSDGRIFLSNK